MKLFTGLRQNKNLFKLVIFLSFILHAVPIYGQETSLVNCIQRLTREGMEPDSALEECRDPEERGGTPETEQITEPLGEVRCYCSRVASSGAFAFSPAAESIEEACEFGRTMQSTDIPSIRSSGCYVVNQQATVTLACGRLTGTRRAIVSLDPVSETGSVNNALSRVLNTYQELNGQYNLARCVLQIEGSALIP
ncbi:MAG: hypothetical protein HC924_09965 [Synechococcaceae cyanobacterium SM2_3_2]|nr:hypothetical protein [Synechococcaceae cyanobacterium SM2_3_2]